MSYIMMQIWLVITVGSYIGVYLLLRVLYPDDKMMSTKDAELPPEKQTMQSAGSVED